VIDIHIMASRVLYFTSMLSQEDFQRNLERAKKELNIDFDYRINRVHRGKQYLNFGFLFLNTPSVFHAFLGNNLDGTKRVERVEIPVESLDWADYEEEEIPLPPLVEFPDIRFSPAEPMKVGEDFSRETICCRDFPLEISLKDLEKELSFYSSRSNYPVAKDKIINKRRVVFLTFHPQTNDAQYALLMLKNTRIGRFSVHFAQSYKNSKSKLEFNKNLS